MTIHLLSSKAALFAQFVSIIICLLSESGMYTRHECVFTKHPSKILLLYLAECGGSQELCTAKTRHHPQTARHEPEFHNSGCGLKLAPAGCVTACGVYTITKFVTPYIQKPSIYMVPSHDKTRHVVVREAVLARCSGSSACAALYHRVHQSLPDSNLILKNTQALRRTTAAVRD